MSLRKSAFLLLLGLMALSRVLSIPQSSAIAQQPTGSIPTVTGTPSGPMVFVDPSLGLIDVYAGPSSTNYPAIGLLMTGLGAPALGRAQGDDNWIMIHYDGVPGSVGWVYALYVSLTGSGGLELPRISIPPTPTPVSTPTINPTLAAAYIPTENATRLPTFTPGAPVGIPTFVDQTQHPSRIPVGLLIFGFAVIGVLGTMISFLRGR